MKLEISRRAGLFDRAMRPCPRPVNRIALRGLCVGVHFPSVRWHSNNEALRHGRQEDTAGKNKKSDCGLPQSLFAEEKKTLLLRARVVAVFFRVELLRA